MQLNFKQPKYVLPLLVLPFLFLFFYVVLSSAKATKNETKQVIGLNGTVGDVAQDVRNKDLASKIDAFRNTYTETDGSSAVTAIPSEISSNPSFSSADHDKGRLDSINRLMKKRFATHSRPASAESNDQALAGAIAAMHANRKSNSSTPLANTPDRDPMDVFKQQMAYMDSLNKANDPTVKAERAKHAKEEQLAAQKKAETNFTVTRAGADDEGFNTVRPEIGHDFIKAIIDENITGYAGSRLRIRLLDDIRAGDYLVSKGTYLYALVTGFSGQRIELSIPSIMTGGKIFPVKLQVYDLDGLPGLYVPESAFRDFTKDLSGNTLQGVSIDGGTSGNQFVMSTVDRVLQSTSTAITGLIRKDKAKLKYSSYIYLIDSDDLQKAQRSY